MKTRSLLAFAAAGVALAACQGLKDAFSAHVDIAARAGSQELSVTRLGNLLGKTPLQVQPTKENATVIAGLWVDYQLLGLAAAKGDSLNSQKEIDAAAQSYIADRMLQHFQTVVDSSLGAGPPSEATYDAGASDVYAARHILFQFPLGATQPQKDSVKKKAESVLAQVNDKNFAEMAKKYSGDPGSAKDGGQLPVFAKPDMVPEFGAAVAGLKPGQISKLVQTQFGYHIIQRLTYAQIKAQYDSTYPRIASAGAERAYIAKLDSTSNIQVKPGAANTAKVAALDMAGHRNDKTVLATFNGGQLTVGRYVMWLDGMPPQQNIPARIQTAPDSLIDNFLHGLAGQEVMLHRADSLHLGLTADEKDQLYKGFAGWVSQGWAALGVDPKMLADSVKGGEAARERFAAARVDSLLDNIMTGKARAMGLPTPVRNALEAKYNWTINQAGIERAVADARTIRTSADSARAANQPPSQVPLPGQPPKDTNKAPSKKP
jgi:parvulin-like peptidyl-prolyl isomerase